MTQSDKFVEEAKSIIRFNSFHGQIDKPTFDDIRNAVALSLSKSFEEGRQVENERILKLVHEQYYHEMPEQQLLDAIRSKQTLTRRSEKEK